MAYGAGGELWFVNTRFSCLCHARPPSQLRAALAAAVRHASWSRSDRCHLNGLGDGGRPARSTSPRWARPTTPAGWRANKAKGGILMDVDSGEVLAPRACRCPTRRAGTAAGCGSASRARGRSASSTRTPAGTSRSPRCRASRAGSTSPAISPSSGCRRSARSAVFSGIPITERLAAEERTCGVCVVDLRRGEVVALLKFESGVQEVFAVTVLPRRFPDLINDDEKLLENSFVVPTECLGEVAATVRASGPADALTLRRGPPAGRTVFDPVPSCFRRFPCRCVPGSASLFTRARHAARFARRRSGSA